MKILPNDVGKLTDANITDLRECHWHDLSSPGSIPAEVRLWKKKWDSSEGTKPHIYRKQWVQHPAPCSQICSAFFTCCLMLISVTSAGVERANSALNLVERANSALTVGKTVKLSSVHQDRLSTSVLLHVHRTSNSTSKQLMTSTAGSNREECFSLIPERPSNCY